MVTNFSDPHFKKPPDVWWKTSSIFRPHGTIRSINIAASNSSTTALLLKWHHVPRAGSAFGWRVSRLVFMGKSWKAETHGFSPWKKGGFPVSSSNQSSVKRWKERFQIGRYWLVHIPKKHDQMDAGTLRSGKQSQKTKWKDPPCY